MGLGKRIGEKCIRQGLTIRQLSLKAGVPYSTLYSAIKRDSDGMDFETVKNLLLHLIHRGMSFTRVMKLTGMLWTGHHRKMTAIKNNLILLVHT